MIQAQKLKRLAIACRSIHPDDVVVDDSDDLMNRIEIVGQALNRQQKEQDRLSQEINILFEQFHALTSETNAKEAAKKRQSSVQMFTIRIPVKSRRKLARSA